MKEAVIVELIDCFVRRVGISGTEDDCIRLFAIKKLFEGLESLAIRERVENGVRLELVVQVGMKGG